MTKSVRVNNLTTRASLRRVSSTRRRDA